MELPIPRGDTALRASRCLTSVLYVYSYRKFLQLSHSAWYGWFTDCELSYVTRTIMSFTLFTRDRVLGQWHPGRTCGVTRSNIDRMKCNSWTHYPPSRVPPIRNSRRSIGHCTDCAPHAPLEPLPVPSSMLNVTYTSRQLYPSITVSACRGYHTQGYGTFIRTGPDVEEIRYGVSAGILVSQ